MHTLFDFPRIGVCLFPILFDIFDPISSLKVHDENFYLKYNTLGEPKCYFDVYLGSFKAGYFDSAWFIRFSWFRLVSRRNG